MNVLVNEIGTVIEAMRVALGTPTPYYMYGHRLEISNRLLNKTNDPIKKQQKYPLIALKMDFEEPYANEVYSYKLNMAILASTKGGYNTEERYANVFIPILYPLYEQFFVSLKNSGLFMWPIGLTKPKHVKIDRPYYGTVALEGNQKSIFNDPLDAIEIVNLEINAPIRTSCN